MSPEHFVELEGKEVLKKKKERICEKDTEINLKEPPMAKTGTIWAINDRTGL